MRKMISKFIAAAGMLLCVNQHAVAGVNGLLGVQIEYPRIGVSSTAGMTSLYDADVDTLTINSVPTFVTCKDGDAPQFVTGGSLVITATINGAGDVSGGTFTLSGSVASGACGDPSGTLLSGNVVDYGIQDFGGSIPDAIDFKLDVTGGTMAGKFNDGFGAALSLGGSTFEGSFGATWGATSASGDVGSVPAPVVGPGVHTQGFWKNHACEWPDTCQNWGVPLCPCPSWTLTLGSRSFHKIQLLGILLTPPRGDKTIVLAKQLIAAKLNVLVGNDDSCIADTITAANNWLKTYPVGSGKRDWDGADAYHDLLGAYNDGLLCAPPAP